MVVWGDIEPGLSVAVVGGGIGGLAAALALLAEGIDVHVYEQSASIREVGAGIAVSPNATRVLYRLGLRPDLERAGVRPTAWWQRRWEDGRTLTRNPLGAEIEHRFGFPQYQMHRGDLVADLARALPEDRLHLGHRLVSVRDVRDGVEACFANGAQARADLLVGADGIHSVVRTLAFGPAAPSFTGCVAYRGLVPMTRLTGDIEPAIQLWVGPHGHVAHYPVSSGRLLNVVGVIEQDDWTTESWTEPGDVVELRSAYAGWHPDVRVVLDAVDETFRWALFERPPMPEWSRGRIRLLGDACHAMLPFLAQGAAQAIEDGVALAAVLSRVDAPGAVPAALQAYEAMRRPRVTRVQRMAAANKVRLHLPDGEAQRRRDAEFARGDSDVFFSAWDWLYDHDPAMDATGHG